MSMTTSSPRISRTLPVTILLASKSCSSLSNPVGDFLVEDVVDVLDVVVGDVELAEEVAVDHSVGGEVARSIRVRVGGYSRVKRFTRPRPIDAIGTIGSEVWEL